MLNAHMHILKYTFTPQKVSSNNADKLVAKVGLTMNLSLTYSLQ